MSASLTLNSMGGLKDAMDALPKRKAVTAFHGIPVYKSEFLPPWIAGILTEPDGKMVIMIE